MRVTVRRETAELLDLLQLQNTPKIFTLYFISTLKPMHAENFWKEIWRAHKLYPSH